MLRLRAHLNPASGFSYDFYLFEDGKYFGKPMVPKSPILMEESSPSVRMDPFFHLEKDSIQELMDSLWMIGIRPSKEVASTGQIEAIKYHLEDMRKIALGLLTHELRFQGKWDGKESL